MNEIKITTELCAEDRARIDKLTATLEGLVINIAPAATEPEKAEVKEPEKVETPAEPENVPEEVPEHTKAELQQKVISLVTAGKKDEVKAIIEQYAERVSAIPAEKINEVWDKLTELES